MDPRMPRDLLLLRSAVAALGVSSAVVYAVTATREELMKEMSPPAPRSPPSPPPRPPPAKAPPLFSDFKMPKLDVSGDPVHWNTEAYRWTDFMCCLKSVR